MVAEPRSKADSRSSRIPCGCRSSWVQGAFERGPDLFEKAQEGLLEDMRLWYPKDGRASS